MKSLAALLVLALSAGAQTTWFVDANGTPPGTGTSEDPYTSIQDAIDQPTTLSSDTLSIAAGTYVENLNTGTKGLTIVGEAGPEQCRIEAAAPGHVIEVPWFAHLKGLTITGGHGPGDADGVYISFVGSANIERCLVVENAGHGVWLRTNGSTGAGIRHSTLAGNGLEGLRMQFGSSMVIEHTIIWGNGLDPVLSFGPHPQNGMFYNDIENNPLFGGGCNYQWCGNFGHDPLFVDAANGDYHLLAGSSCINTGDPAAPLDPDGTRADVGALPFDSQSAPGPSVYCTSTVNSQGCTPTIGSSGTPSVTGAAFDITCSNVINNKVGLLFYGYQSKSLAYQGGTLCVTGALRRTPLQTPGGNPPPDDCSGVFSFDFDARIQSGIDPLLYSGAVIFAQYWYRDPQSMSGFTTARSDALAFTILP